MKPINFEEELVKLQNAKRAAQEKQRANGAEPNAPDIARPTIVVNNRPLRDISNNSVAALVTKNVPPALFVRSGRLTRRVYDEDHRPILDALTESALCGFLARSADFITRQPTSAKDHTLKEIHVPPPLVVVRDVYALGSWPLPPLAGLVECPVLRPNGTIVSEAGYDAATRLFYEPAPGLIVPPLPDEPTEEDARAAAQYVMNELLSDFPLCGPADLANMVGAFLTPPVRPTIKEGSVPL
jgi:hypothetical protein